MSALLRACTETRGVLDVSATLERPDAKAGEVVAGDGYVELRYRNRPAPPWSRSPPSSSARWPRSPPPSAADRLSGSQTGRYLRRRPSASDRNAAAGAPTRLGAPGAWPMTCICWPTMSGPAGRCCRRGRPGWAWPGRCWRNWSWLACVGCRGRLLGATGRGRPEDALAAGSAGPGGWPRSSRRGRWPTGWRSCPAPHPARWPAGWNGRVPGRGRGAAMARFAVGAVRSRLRVRTGAPGLSPRCHPAQPADAQTVALAGLAAACGLGARLAAYLPPGSRIRMEQAAGRLDAGLREVITQTHATVGAALLAHRI